MLKRLIKAGIEKENSVFYEIVNSCLFAHDNAWFRSYLADESFGVLLDIRAPCSQDDYYFSKKRKIGPIRCSESSIICFEAKVIELFLKNPELVERIKSSHCLQSGRRNQNNQANI